MTHLCLEVYARLNGSEFTHTELTGRWRRLCKGTGEGSVNIKGAADRHFVRAKWVCTGGLSKATLPEFVTPFGGKHSRIQVPTMQCKFNNCMCVRVRDLKSINVLLSL